MSPGVNTVRANNKFTRARVLRSAKVARTINLANARGKWCALIYAQLNTNDTYRIIHVIPLTGIRMTRARSACYRFAYGFRNIRQIRCIRSLELEKPSGFLPTP